MQKDPFISSAPHWLRGLKIWLLVIVVAGVIGGILFFPSVASSLSGWIKSHFPRKAPSKSIETPIQSPPQASLPQSEQEEIIPSLPASQPVSQQPVILEGRLLSHEKEGQKIFSLELSENSLKELLQNEFFKEPVSTIQLQDKGLLPEDWLNQKIQVVGNLTQKPDSSYIFEINQATLLPR